MAITKNIIIDGREVPFRTSAAMPRLYRLRFGRDLFRDMDLLVAGLKTNDENNSMLPIESLEIFENISFIMARYADPTIPDDPMKWLDEFKTFSIYDVLPQILSLWGLNVETESESKKKAEAPTAP